jgi:hypothetical protein
MATFRKIGAVERPVLTAESIAQEKQKKDEAKAAQVKSAKVPTLNDLMRRFYKKIHPDLMMAYPEQKEANEKSLGIFQNFIPDFALFLFLFSMSSFSSFSDLDLPVGERSCCCMA